MITGGIGSEVQPLDAVGPPGVTSLYGQVQVIADELARVATAGRRVMATARVGVLRVDGSPIGPFAEDPGAPPLLGGR